jgi:cytochrome P450
LAKEIVAERFGPNKKSQRDMLGSFIAHGLTQEEAESEILVQILGGSDTTATAIRVVILYLSTNPRVLSKFLEEIAAHSPSSPIQESEAKNMPYLQAIIKEGLRLWPPASGLITKTTPPQGDTFNGMFIPGGTDVGYSAWGVFRNKKFWGADANEFRPERWFGLEKERLKEMDDTMTLIFGFGKYTCLGKGVAMIELNKVFVEVSCSSL